ncbi:hypothetical protein [Limnoglobus roseus]|uniref:TIGR03000 domain-containing protein n=1 Tax=Limnoglobus roseus TaxID=2598579 RepID=A0A5C1A4V8_9BACT|nr:hypothetical protein [Limnoglobus roseus]QEL13345.1 hypothetical protein PX52LOC_00199 [Limnoglobus roseus]
MRYASFAALLLFASPAAAQYGYPQGGGYGGGGYQNYGPNPYNRANQPLSPYLNLNRGANPATNYYYGVRPGLPTGGLNTFGQVPPIQNPVGPQYGGFLPQSQIPYDPAGQTYEPGGVPVRLNSPGHPVLFGNQFANHGSFSSVYAQNINRSGFGSQQRQSGQSISGLGNANRPPNTTPARGATGRP